MFGASTAALLLLIAFLSSEMLLSVNGTIDAHRDVIIDLEVVFDTIHEGRMSFFMGNAERDDLDLDLKTWPPTEGIDNTILLNLYENLSVPSNDVTALFLSVLKGNGDVKVLDPNISFHRDGERLGIWIEASFHFNSSMNNAEYDYLSFMEPIHLPPLDRSDPASVVRYNDAVEEMSRVVISIYIDPPQRSNLDLQWDGSYHWRRPSGEGVRFSSDLVAFTGSGHRFSLIGNPCLSPAATMYFTLAITVIGALISVMACLRRRFRRWALIFPSGSILLLPMPFMFYIRPYLNPYGLYDAGLLFISVLFVSYSIFMHFAPTGARRDPAPESEEENPEVEFEMPKVIYVDRPIIVKAPRSSDNDRGEDPYKVLGVDRNASMEDVDKAYRSLVLKCHPDRMHKAEDWVGEAARERTQKLNRAYEEVQRQRAGGRGAH